MKKHLLLALGLFVIWVLPASQTFGAVEHTAQDDYEKSIEAVVRHKHFYKAGKFELGVVAGVMPYDSLINHYMAGGRLTWHLADHFGWEIADLQKTFPSLTSFSTDLVSSKGISNLQTVRIGALASTNFIISPLYGKIRFFGRQVLYYDIYLVLGGGMAHTEVLQLSASGTNQPVTQSILKSGFDPMFDFGFGFKVFTNDAMSVLIDMRDYVIDSKIYGGNSLKSNFSVYVGLSFFLPFFG